MVGIFEASVSTALLLLEGLDGSGGESDEQGKPMKKFGIVSTGAIWETLLTDAVNDFLGYPSSSSPSPPGTTRFAGVRTTGLSATELHTFPPELIELRIKEATKALLETGDVGVICLGCAGMVGMERIVREACVGALGEEGGAAVKVVDGVKAGVGALVGIVKGDF